MNYLEEYKKWINSSFIDEVSVDTNFIDQQRLSWFNLYIYSNKCAFSLKQHINLYNDIATRVAFCLYFHFIAKALLCQYFFKIFLIFFKIFIKIGNIL